MTCDCGSMCTNIGRCFNSWWHKPQLAACLYHLLVTPPTITDGVQCVSDCVMCVSDCVVCVSDCVLCVLVTVCVSVTDLCVCQ